MREADFAQQPGHARRFAHPGKPEAQKARATRRRSLVGPAQVLVALTITAGWSMREDRWFVPDEGVGYAFGIIGLGLMILLLLYPLRKRLRLIRNWGRLSNWFEIHMLFGLFGPLAILYHANFRMGSLNANVALVSTLTVAASGIVGRVIYRRIYEQLTGRRRTLAEIRIELEKTREHLAGDEAATRAMGDLVEFEEALLGRGNEGLAVLSMIFSSPWHSRVVKKKAFRAISQGRHGAAETKRARNAIRQYIRAVRGVADFSVYEWFFGLWHVAHLPLAVLLYATALVHVLAVHMY